MFSADLGGATPASTPAATDPPFQKVALLLHGDGTNGAQNNTFVDSSTNNFSITRTGNVAQGTFSPFSLAEGQWSNYFDGSGDYLTTGSTIALGTSDFTVEMWVYRTAAKATEIIFCGTTNGGFSIGFESSGTVISISRTQVAYIKQQSATVPLNQWFHLAVSKSSNVYKIFLNGVQQGTDTTNSNSITTAAYRIGENINVGFEITGYISNVRVVNGTAVYTSNFTPSTTPLTAISGTSLLTCQSNRFKDNSSNNFTITRNGDTKVTAFSPFASSAAYDASTNGGSGYFDGSGDYFTIPNVAELRLGAGDFTVEAWVNPSRHAVTYFQTICGTYGYVGSDRGWMIDLLSNGTLRLYMGGSSGAAFSLTTTSVVPMNVWSHVAAVRSGTTVTLYLNGVSVATATSSKDEDYSGLDFKVATGYAYQLSPPIGNPEMSFQGYISNLRIVKGTAVYTSNFTPPTAPLTAISGTSLLLNCTNAGIIDNSGKNDIETVGNAQISTSVKKYGTGSMYFDGSGDWLIMPANQTVAFETGDFTIEAWIYLPTTPSGSYAAICDTRINAANGVVLAVNSSRQVVYYIGGQTYNYGSVSLNAWTHVVLTRSSGTNRVFIDGVQAGSVSNAYNTTGNIIYVGRVFDANHAAFNGYIDDLRITKGQALYTANFTPPTQAFPDV